jgi:hypothetical protein
MARATIRSKTGAVITVVGSESEVSNILSAFERTATIGHAAVVQAREAVAKSKTAKKESKARMSASDLIVGLKEDGFFEKPKNIGDISKALDERGFLYPVTSLSGILLTLVQKRLLRRKKVGGRWVYGK